MHPTRRQREIVALAGTLAARFAERANANDTASLFPHENYGPLHDTGYLNLFLPERTDGGWLLTGRKIFVTGAPVLRFLATAVVLPPSDTAPQGELVSALVDGRTQGLRIENTCAPTPPARSPKPRCGWPGGSA